MSINIILGKDILKQSEVHTDTDIVFISKASLLRTTDADVHFNNMSPLIVPLS